VVVIKTTEAIWERAYLSVTIFHGAFLGAILGGVDWKSAKVLVVLSLSPIFFYLSLYFTAISALGHSNTRFKDIVNMAPIALLIFVTSGFTSRFLVGEWYLLPFVVVSWTYCSILIALLLKRGDEEVEDD
jgi:preprotein translocase subunit SecF